MAQLDKEFEMKAMKLLNVLTLPRMEDVEEGSSKDSLNDHDQVLWDNGGRADMKIDLDKINDYGSNDKSSFITVKAKGKVKPIVAQRRSLRERVNQGGSIQESRGY
ncbi:hypothetical protein C2845_PM03G18590 [Panicum miliaceum]|uniref:Uncharacterized protein n=1 Tax=Panicum miliaceum TaxID=4540 RepID=A0A3L6TFD9_PANMI|nr:hypothetical protein C2845_PM03G18590 [Panicum miliaceum]